MRSIEELTPEQRWEFENIIINWLFKNHPQYLHMVLYAIQEGSPIPEYSFDDLHEQ